MKELSYHDVKVICNGETYIISDNYAYQLLCTKVSGWCLWYKWDKDEKLIGGEYNKDDFKIMVGDLVILDVKKEIEEEEKI